MDCVRALLAQQADYRVRDKATGSNLFHLAAEKCASDTVFEYLFKNLKVDVFARNGAGHTPLTLCEASPWKSERRIACIEEVQSLYDESAKKTDELLDELVAEEDKKERATQKRKEKKHRSKLLKLAEKHGCTVDQLE